MAQNPLTLAVAQAVKLPERGVQAVLGLLGEGATVPFVARYRKEATGSLDEVQIRAIADAHERLQKLEARRATVLAALEAQGVLTDALKGQVLAAGSTALEDLYLPYKKRKKTRADTARDRGLAPLAQRLLAQPSDGREAEANAFLGDEVPDREAAWAGARDIVAETAAEHAELRKKLRWLYAKDGRLTAKLTKSGKDGPFAEWDAYQELARKMPSHRVLALDRGESEKALRVKLTVDRDAALEALRGTFPPRGPLAAQLSRAIEDAYDRLLGPSLEREFRGELRERAHHSAVEVFADNLKNLLLAPPFGAEAVLGVDPGLRTGSKCAMVAASGALVAHDTVFLARGDKDEARAKGTLERLVKKSSPRAIAVGNGTGGRETEAFLRAWVRDQGLNIPVVSVNEAGASVYSASDVAREEFPDIDLTVRGAVSIARRLQDPLAELVKIDPKSIGVGQYQHDVKSSLLESALGAVVEDCVHGVGVDLSTASAPLLARVSGVGPKLAKNIVSHREAKGGFRSRRELLSVKGLGKKAFEQAAGFLRVANDEQPLDRSAVHPERYPLVARMAKDLGIEVQDLLGHADKVGRIELERYVDEGTGVGLPTLRDIRAELLKPGRDPREAFEAPAFRDDVHTLEDLETGMVLEGVVTNVTSFGAFVDIGVHQDGLVHVSELSDTWVSNPADVVKVGDRVTVRVLDVDLGRKRIGLSRKKL